MLQLLDCMEIIEGKDARASLIPLLLVIDDRTKLTHEEAIRSADKKQWRPWRHAG